MDESTVKKADATISVGRLKERRQALEVELLDILRNFEDESGCYISMVDVRHMRVDEMQGVVRRVVTSVEVKICL